jgi:hypothetical protein
VEKPGVKVALEMLRQEFDLALGAELGQSMNEFRKAREEIDRGSSTIPELNLLCLFTRQVAAETSAPATDVGTQGKNLWRRVWPYGLRETSESYGCQNSAATRAVSAAARKGSQS